MRFKRSLALICDVEIWTVAAFGERWESIAKGDKETFCGDGNVLYFNGEGGYRSVYGLP